MRREKRIMVVAHCVLNQNTVIRQWERAPGAFNHIVRVLLDKNIGILQLPCPEFNFLGEDRPPMTKEEYNTVMYRQLCSQISLPIVKQIKEYICQGYKVLGILGIQGSPSCDSLGKQGIFMEELLGLLSKEKIELMKFDIPENYLEGESNHTVEHFKQYIDEQC